MFIESDMAQFSAPGRWVFPMRRMISVMLCLLGLFISLEVLVFGAVFIWLSFVVQDEPFALVFPMGCIIFAGGAVWAYLSLYGLYNVFRPLFQRIGWAFRSIFRIALEPAHTA